MIWNIQYSRSDCRKNYTPQIVTILHINVRGSIESIAFVPREEKRAYFCRKVEKQERKEQSVFVSNYDRRLPVTGGGSIGKWDILSQLSWMALVRSLIVLFTRGCGRVGGLAAVSWNWGLTVDRVFLESAALLSRQSTFACWRKKRRLLWSIWTGHRKHIPLNDLLTI